MYIALAVPQVIRMFGNSKSNELKSENQDP